MAEGRPTIVVDIDGVLATGGPEVYSNEAGWAYEKCTPILETISFLRYLRQSGIRIVLHTARWEEDRAKTSGWLSMHNVPYDQLVMGKPSGVLYLDDRSWPHGFDPAIHATVEAAEALLKRLRDIQKKN